MGPWNELPVSFHWLACRNSYLQVTADFFAMPIATVGTEVESWEEEEARWNQTKKIIHFSKLQELEEVGAAFAGVAILFTLWLEQ